ncbi:hypothetical protein [Alloyangia pacifica]|uniref:Uncharacterized protein n=1 Tax=Alloyangia pacifica TaxID=311180 RepID=A0A1I6U0U9_9RHOB|nr:hypothetical protein [Alloyangia pacifica]SDH32687.1 hypothetical protein SAMN04488245_10737 [Alloyangia pacifica]SFS95050.1 hypothetical protein SAMN04488050_10737 [Alloyangia pacifica]
MRRACRRTARGIARLCRLCCLFALLPCAVVAQTIEVRSGEHAGFTRLVLDLPAGVGWQGKVAAERIYRIELDSAGFDFALDGVFRRIGGERLSEVTALDGGRGLELRLACDCIVDASQHDGRMAVLDIRARRADEPLPGPTAPPAAFSTEALRASVSSPGTVPGSSSGPETGQRSGQRSGQGAGAEFGPEAGPGFAQAPAVVVATAQTAQEGAAAGAAGAGVDLGLLPGLSDAAGARSLLPVFDPGPALAAQAEATQAEREIADDFGRALAEQLALGATQGLLDADGPGRAPSETANRGEAVPGTGGVQPSAQSSAQTSAPTSDPLGAELVTGSPAQGFGSSSVLRIGGQRACLDDRRLDVPGWFGTGGEAGAVARIGELRGRLLGEFDRVDGAVQRDLARLYVSLGFGAEARALLRLEDDLPDPVLMTLATLSEGGSDPAGVFAGQSECPGRAALWAVLGARGLPENAEIAIPAVMSAFEELPLGLRQSLGPRLAERLVEERHNDAARNVLSRLARALGRSTEEMQLASARIARASGNPAEAGALLSELIAAPGELGVAAAVESIELAAEEGQPVAPGMVDLTAAYSTERRTTDARDTLWLTHVRAAWASGEFDRAFAEIAAPGDVATETALQARTEALGALTDAGDDGKFLRHAMDPENIALAPASPRLALRIADRLLALGLPEAAGTWLAGPAPPGQLHDWRLLQARGKLAQQQPEEAEIALIGLQGNDVLRLRAAAREAMGDYDFARTAYAELGDAENAARLAWLAGDLDATAGGVDPLRAEAAALAQAAPPDLGPLSLAQGKALAESGQDTIDTVRALLAGSALPEF